MVENSDGFCPLMVRTCGPKSLQFIKLVIVLLNSMSRRSFELFRMTSTAGHFQINVADLRPID
jgi:hypothetical protein